MQISGTEFHPNRKDWQKCTYCLEQSAIVIEPLATKLSLDGQLFVRKPSAKFHENPVVVYSLILCGILRDCIRVFEKVGLLALWV